MIVSFDTNVLVYAMAPAAAEKKRRALELITRGMRGGRSVLLLQTLAEFCNVTLRKAKLSVGEVRVALDAWRAVLPVHAAHQDDLPAALEVVKAHRLAFWDAVLWATARRVGVRRLLTEDMQDGKRMGALTIRNPFLAA